MSAKTFHRIETKSTHLQVYRVLKRAILAGYFRPGEQVTIRGLASQLGTSEMPVREAIKRLVAQNAIEATSDRKFRIPVLSRQQIRDILELRELLEGLAAEQAATGLTPEELCHIESIHNEHIAALDSLDIEAMLIANYRFHFAIYAHCANRALLPLIESLWLQYSPTLAEYAPKMLMHPPEDHRKADRVIKGTPHAQVLDALKKRDGKTARKNIRDDLESFLSVVDQMDDIPDEFEHHRTVEEYARLVD